MSSDKSPCRVRSVGSDAPEKTELRVGFMPLTDCAPVVMAAVKDFASRYGIRIVLSRESSWAAIRDKLIAGELDAAQALYGLVYGVHLGIGGLRRDMAILATLSQNGQGITLARQFAEAGVRDGASLRACLAATPGRHIFAQTFPTGTHAMWLNYWLAAHGIDPLRDVSTLTVPPPQMVAQMREGRVHGYCVGEPWNHRAIIDGVGFTVATSQDIWPDHPEKVLAVTADWADRHPHAARALTAAILEAARWLDASTVHRTEAAALIARSAYVDTDQEAILARMQGQYRDGLGREWTDAHPMRFFADGAVNFPYLSDGMWFLTQFRRWGLLAQDPDYPAVAQAVQRTDIYMQAAEAAGVTIPPSTFRSARLIDGVVWDGHDPAAYARGFAIRA